MSQSLSPGAFSGKVDATFPVRKRDQQVFKALVLMQSKHEAL
jgi:hypothetical protein